MLKKGYLDVGDGHRLFYETSGNPEGVNVLFLHGGPGWQYNEEDKRFFDPEIHHIIFFDQRGCGKSTPKGSIAHNTTPHLVDDINRLLDFLQIEKVILFGGSWGSSLALIYAIQFPHRVNGLLLRGVFAATRKAAQYIETGEVATYFPDVWQRYLENVPQGERNDVRNFYFKMLRSTDPEVKRKFAYEMAFYGASLATKRFDPVVIQTNLEKLDYVSKMSIQCHFSENDFFIPDNFILDNLDKIENHPIVIIHGRYDVMCPPIFAYEFYQKLKNAKLYLVDAGHLSSEPEIESRLIAEMKKLSNSKWIN